MEFGQNFFREIEVIFLKSKFLKTASNTGSSHSRPKKTREIRYINFTKKNFFDQIHFCTFKNDQKSIFELGKSLKLSKLQFHEKK